MDRAFREKNPESRIPQPATEENVLGRAMSAQGERVHVATVTAADIVPYRIAVEGSRARLSRWNPVDPHDLSRHLRWQSASHRTFIVHASEPEGDHDIVGRINVTNVVRGRALAAAMGYDAYDPYAGRGLFAEGLRLVVDLAFAPEPIGMGLHRVEASVQPGNVRSAGLLRSLGFRLRGEWPEYLWLPDETGRHAWRDHLNYGVVSSEWPARPYAPVTRRRTTVVLPAGALDKPTGVTTAAQLADELSAVVLSAAQAETLGSQAAVQMLRAADAVILEDCVVTRQMVEDLSTCCSPFVLSATEWADLLVRGGPIGTVSVALRARACGSQAVRCFASDRNGPDSRLA
ncbi:Protein N-acetyltransferase, RimJ/RimL family [Austwickia chelonae]|uniref:Putative methyl-accepting chemotaxis protein n=1 Tax=Austwickia chelonae NBRC 105200 TaxID=1184607 RepID=K6UKP1_9MICO|nr:GNAT family protein [Austwickia chelonae]GAB76571.1 putative methyl-accepting chemotaxis protein [Austwickia chelonae NBRC 105200]SEW27103.1 Protein N-acetyltransferase, RimJ/RimL family [Austwickia chelonae]